MNNSLLERLLYEEEGPALDLKRDQYPFKTASNEQKSELLKDILAFANSWRREDAFLLIGVEDVKGGRSNVVGLTEHLDDASLQEFVNKKTQKPITFSYEPFDTTNGQIGVIRIAVQQRPIFLKNDFGKLKRNVVYVRRGSSTDEANPEEIIQKGSIVVETSQPILDLEFADSKTRMNQGHSIKLSSEILKYERNEIPFYGRSSHPILAGINRDNKQYFIQLAGYLFKKSLLREINFRIRNLGSKLASNVRLRIVGEKMEKLKIIDEAHYPYKPSTSTDYIIPGRLANMLNPTKYSVNHYKDDWVFEAKLDDIQPKDEVITKKALFIGSLEPCSLDWEGIMFADSLSDPIKIPLTIDIKTIERKLDLSELGISEN